MEEPRLMIMRPPKITVISQDEYQQKYWPHIGNAVSQILRNPDKIDFSQEELCRSIYNVCCQRYCTLLYQNMMDLVSVPDDVFLQCLLNSWLSFRKSSSVIQTICRYLEKVYVREKLRTSMDKEFALRYRAQVLSPLSLPLSEKLSRIPPPCDPTTCMNLVKQLFEIDRDYVKLNPRLFSLYIPQLVTSRGPEADIRETNEFFAQWQQQDASSGSLKRKYLSTS